LFARKLYNDHKNQSIGKNAIYTYKIVQNVTIDLYIYYICREFHYLLFGFGFGFGLEKCTIIFILFWYFGFRLAIIGLVCIICLLRLDAFY